MADVQKPGVDDWDVPTWQNPSQIDALLDAIYQASPDDLQLRDEALITLAYDTGLHANEIVGLDVNHFHLTDSGPNVFVPAENQKGGEKYARDTPIELRPSLGTARLLRHYLRDRWKDTAAVFSSWSSPRRTTDAFRNVVAKLAVGAKIEPYRILAPAIPVQPRIHQGRATDRGEITSMFAVFKAHLRRLLYVNPVRVTAEYSVSQEVVQRVCESKPPTFESKSGRT